MKELIIPIKGDVSDLMEKLKTLGLDLKDLGDKGEKSQSQVSGLMKEMMKFASVQEAVSLAKTMFASLADTFKEASEYINRMSNQYTNLQMQLRMTAELEGRKLDAAYVQEQVSKAGQSRYLSTTEYAAYKKEFQYEGSDYVGPGKNISQQVADSLILKVADLSKIKGVTPKSAMGLLAGVIQNMPGAGEEEILTEYMKAFEISKVTKGDPEETVKMAIQMLSANVGKGMPFGEGKKGVRMGMKLLGASEEAFHAEALTFLNDAVKLLRRADMKGESAELGITEDMTAEQQIEAVAKKWVQEDPERKSFDKWFQQYAHGQGAEQGIKGLRVLVARGFLEGRLGRWEEKLGEVTPETYPTKMDEAAKTELGQQIAETARGTRAEEKRAGLYDPVKTAVGRTVAEMKEAGEFEKGGGFADMITGFGLKTGLKAEVPKLEGLSEVQSYRAYDETFNRLARRLHPEAVGRMGVMGGDPSAEGIERGAYLFSGMTIQQYLRNMLDRLEQGNQKRDEQTDHIKKSGQRPLTVRPTYHQERGIAEPAT